MFAKCSLEQNKMNLNNIGDQFAGDVPDIRDIAPLDSREGRVNRFDPSCEVMNT
jgi:hypothetical protein